MLWELIYGITFSFLDGWMCSRSKEKQVENGQSKKLKTKMLDKHCQAFSICFSNLV